MNLEKLREEIAEIIELHATPDYDGCFDRENMLEVADRILAIPSIATALRFTDLHRSAGNVVGDPKIKPQAKGS